MSTVSKYTDYLVVGRQRGRMNTSGELIGSNKLTAAKALNVNGERPEIILEEEFWDIIFQQEVGNSV